MLVDTNGDGDLSDETAQVVVSPPGTLFPNVVSSPSGTIIGRATAISGEANWGGFQLARIDAVPTEATSWGRIKSPLQK